MKDTRKLILFIILRGAIFGVNSLTEQEKGMLKSNSDWRNVFEELKTQAVLFLVFPILDELNIDDLQLLSSIRQDCFYSQVKCHQIAFAQKEMLGLLQQKGIPCVIIKGFAAAQYYPKPFLRAPGDVDFLVARKDFI